MPLVITPVLVLPDSDVSESFVRSSGPGGQNVNKVSTAVELRLDIGRAALPASLKVRLRALAGQRVTKDDVLVIDAREHRTQTQNREAARERLAALLRRAATPVKKRRKTAPTAAARARRITAKIRRSKVKQNRRVSED